MLAALLLSLVPGCSNESANLPEYEPPPTLGPERLKYGDVWSQSNSGKPGYEIARNVEVEEMTCDQAVAFLRSDNNDRVEKQEGYLKAGFDCVTPQVVRAGDPLRYKCTKASSALIYDE